MDIPFEQMERTIQEALIQAEKQQIRGKDITPFLLRAVSEMTGGESLQANIALVKNNARLAAEIAVCFSK
jgi:pseudouridine-5'-phosphate glycosidase